MAVTMLVLAVVGASLGAVLAYARGPRGRGLLRAVAGVQVLAVLYLAWAAEALPLLTFVGPGVIVGLLLVSGLVWRESPVLAGRPYWSRAGYAFFDERGLRRAHRERSRVEEPTT